MLRAEITVSLELDTKEKGSKLKQCKISEKVSLKTKNLDPPPCQKDQKFLNFRYFRKMLHRSLLDQIKTFLKLRTY